MEDNPGTFTQGELAAMWRGHLTREELAAIKAAADALIKGWRENLSPEESGAWIEAYVGDLERKLRHQIGG